jgi:hypothetical protein
MFEKRYNLTLYVTYKLKTHCRTAKEGGEFKVSIVYVYGDFKL